ncbi:MAG TPA: hypothetical protein VH989_11075 [Actinomycetota bacterium]
MKRSALVAGALGLTVIGVLVAGVIATDTPPRVVVLPGDQTSPPSPDVDALGEGLHADPDQPTYPEQWKTTLEGAQRQLPFSILVPNDALANPANMTALYLFPTDQLALDFPSPGEPTSRLRQKYIEVFEARWSGDDPVADLKRDLKLDPIEGKSLERIDGVTALVVEAHSPDDAGQANAAFLRFFLPGVEVQISGGESLDDLIRIASTIIIQ